MERTIFCIIELDAAKVEQFREAIGKSYWFEFFIDDLPLWGFVGEVHSDKKNDKSQHLLYTNKNIFVRYNGDQIIRVSLTQDSPKPLEEGKALDMTYSVQWMPIDVIFSQRFDIYLDHHFFEHQIHWFSIFNSFMMVIFLTGLVSMILMRTLRNDYAKYAREDDDLETLERDVSEESGWTLVHGDFFLVSSQFGFIFSCCWHWCSAGHACSPCQHFGNYWDVVYRERSNCHNFYSVLCSYIIHFGLCEWWNVLPQWW